MISEAAVYQNFMRGSARQLCPQDGSLFLALNIVFACVQCFLQRLTHQCTEVRELSWVVPPFITHVLDWKYVFLSTYSRRLLQLLQRHLSTSRCFVVHGFMK